MRYGIHDLARKSSPYAYPISQHADASDLCE